MSIHKTTLLAAATALGLVACIKQDAAPDEITRAIPTSDQVSIKLPENNKSIGQLANWYVATRNVTRTLNGGTAGVLILVHGIVQWPVTSVSGNTYTWGPASNALDPADYKLDVTAVGDGTYDYQFSGKSKTQPNAQFEVLIDGTADPRAGDLLGSGQFLLDFDAGRRVNPVDSSDATGTMSVHYDLAARHMDLIAMSTDANGNPTSADYSYNESDTGGDMTFDVNADAGGGPAAEEVTLRSRWETTGAGRADARVAGGDLGTTQAIASECWDTSFGRVYYTDNVNFSPTEGTPGACAFTTADLPPAH